MKYIKFILFIIYLVHPNYLLASIKSKIIQNFEDTNNLSFEFKQNINEEIEQGQCVIEYPKKIFCEYKNFKRKILVSNGKKLVIKNLTNNQYYIYPIEKTAFNFVVDADQLDRLRRRSQQEERSIGSLIREGVEYTLTNRSYDQGVRDCCQWLRKTTLVDGKDLPDGRTFNEFICER